MLVFVLALGLLGTTANAQAQKNGASATPSTTSCLWKRDNDRTYVCDMTHKELGRIHAVLWHSPKGHIQFTVIARCLTNTNSVKELTWKEGDFLALGETCDGRMTGRQVPKDLEQRLHTLPPTIEAIRVKPTPRESPVEKLT